MSSPLMSDPDILAARIWDECSIIGAAVPRE